MVTLCSLCNHNCEAVVGKNMSEGHSHEQRDSQLHPEVTTDQIVQSLEPEPTNNFQEEFDHALDQLSLTSVFSVGEIDSRVFEIDRDLFMVAVLENNIDRVRFLFKKHFQHQLKEDQMWSGYKEKESLQLSTRQTQFIDFLDMNVRIFLLLTTYNYFSSQLINHKIRMVQLFTMLFDLVTTTYCASL